MHITVQHGEKRPNVEKCVECCSLYHCPFCLPEMFKPTSKSKCWKHLEGHKRRAVQHKEYFIYKCNLKCSSQAHFHCVTCTSTFVRREWFVKHLKICENRRTIKKLPEVIKGENSSQKDGLLSGAPGVSHNKVTPVRKSSAQQRLKDKVRWEPSTNLVSKPACQVNTVKNCHDKQVHITVRQMEEQPKVERCVECCSLYHCPFCLPKIFKPTSKSKCLKHLRGHKRRAVQHKDYLIYKCNLKCSSQAHFHCVTCTSTFVRREWFIKHLKGCEGRRSTRKLTEAISENTSSPKVCPLLGVAATISGNSKFDHLNDCKDPLMISSSPHTPAASPLSTCIDSFVEKDDMVMPDGQEMRMNKEPQGLIKCQECCSLYHSSSEVFKPSDNKDEEQTHLCVSCSKAVKKKGIYSIAEHGDIEEILKVPQGELLRNTMNDGFSQSRIENTDISYGNTNTCCSVAEAAIHALQNQLLSERTSTENAPPKNKERKGSRVIMDLCPWCGLELNRKNLLTHIRRKHPKEKDTVVKDTRSGLNRDRCSVCGHSLLRKNMSQHIRRKHQEKTDTTVKKRKCKRTADRQQPCQMLTGCLKQHVLDSLSNSQKSTAALQHFSHPSVTDGSAPKISNNLPKVQCSICAATILKKNLLVHMFRKHNKN